MLIFSIKPNSPNKSVTGEKASSIQVKKNKASSIQVEKKKRKERLQ
jgi:hypothetical protein